MVLEFIIIKMELYMKGFGRMINKMEVVLKNGQIKASIKVIIEMDLRREMEHLNGKMVVCIKENSRTIILMDMEFINGIMGSNIVGFG
jgi:hypothetical protein